MNTIDPLVVEQELRPAERHTMKKLFVSIRNSVTTTQSTTSTEPARRERTTDIRRRKEAAEAQSKAERDARQAKRDTERKAKYNETAPERKAAREANIASSCQQAYEAYRAEVAARPTMAERKNHDRFANEGKAHGVDDERNRRGEYGSWFPTNEQ